MQCAAIKSMSTVSGELSAVVLCLAAVLIRHHCQSPEIYNRTSLICRFQFALNKGLKQNAVMTLKNKML